MTPIPDSRPLVQADDRSRLVLAGQSNKQFLVQMYDDGSVLLEPAVVLTQAQYEYDTDVKLQALLRRASDEPTVTRPRRQRRKPA